LSISAAGCTRLGAVRTVLIAFVLCVVLAPPALAGRTHYGWINGTEVVPERGVELETWISELDNLGPANRDKTELWWSATIGVTDQLELALPIELAWLREGVTPGQTSLDRWGAELRYRLVSADPIEAPALVPLVRFAVKREVDERRAVNLEAEATLSYARGPVHAAASFAAQQLVRRGDDVSLLRPTAGVSVALVGDLRAGVEGVATFVPRGAGADWAALGPSLAWTHGRFWLAASLPVGVHNIDTAARLRWGIAF
jgi:hypothetical protein